MEDGKLFKCPRCPMSFTSNDLLFVHQQVHKAKENSLVVKLPASSTDQTDDLTPTPTRVDKVSDVEGSSLFDDINPFDNDFKMSSKGSLPIQSNRLTNSSPVSSTSYSSRLFRGVSGKGSKPCENEGEVSSTVFIEGTGILKNQNQNDYRERGKSLFSSVQESSNDQEISSSTNEENTDYEQYSCSYNKNIHDIKGADDRQGEPSCSLSVPASSTMIAEEGIDKPESFAITNDPIVDIPISTDVHSWTKVQNSTCSINSQFSSTLSTADSKDNQNSLQTFLQQIKKEMKTPPDDAESSSDTQSQEILREQLKSLIKTGQIKIKFTPDPASPKVQATIVGNITKKTPVMSKPSQYEIISLPESQITNTASSRPTMVRDIQSELEKAGEGKVDTQSSVDTDLQVNFDKKDVLVQPTSIPPPIKLLTTSLPKLPTAIQFVPKFPISRPIPIAPKKPQPDSSAMNSPLTLSHRPLMPISATAITSSVHHSVQSPSGLGFTKQKLKHIIQGSTTNKNEIDPTINERATMVTSVNLPTKYKDVSFFGTQEGINSSSDPIMSSSMQSISSDNSIFEQTNKRKCKSDETNSDEKRKKFLERNRAAASRCRQKRKVWVNQLETRSDNLSKTNTLLLNELNALRSEVVQLKSLLLAHKDCPVTQQQKALLGQMTPGSYIAAVSDGQIIALHQIPDSGIQEIKSAEEVASSALTDMAMRLPLEMNNNGNPNNVITTSVTVERVSNSDPVSMPAVINSLTSCENDSTVMSSTQGTHDSAISGATSTSLITSNSSLLT